MNQEDKNEIRQLLSDLQTGYHARTEAQFEIIESKVDGVHQRLDKINGRVGKAEDQINQALTERMANRQKQEEYFSYIDNIDMRLKLVEQKEEMHVYKCPIKADLDILKADKSIRLGIKQFIIGGLSLIALLLGISYTIMSIQKIQHEKEKKVFYEKIDEVNEKINRITVEPRK
jgi:predicted ribosome quality control (RQC) complex YloA/Tae2 family protein